MHITASVVSAPGTQLSTVASDGDVKDVPIPPRAWGPGSSLSGGELLFLALATCFVNDVYREGALLGVPVDGVEATVEGDFARPGQPGTGIVYRARVRSSAPESAVRELLERVDSVAEIHKTLRGGATVTLAGVEIVAS
jgi:uncharacterized OsmC-like protein